MKQTTSESDPVALERLMEMVEEIAVAMVTTVTPDGGLHSRPMFTQEASRDGDLWFFASDRSGQEQDLAGEHAVNVSYADIRNDRYVSIRGSAVIVRDVGKLRSLWDERFRRYFTAGVDSTHLRLLHVRIETAEYWDRVGEGMKPVDLAGKKQTQPTTQAPEHAEVAIRAVSASG